ncbi:MAG TPA: hypothetical protein VK742_21205 [Candidatus Sulfotelmatobacter sp.]|jgi:hypothetical protein|nr:hypothetical protein [Candidatus Sulfotelmatobacter sp.]
MDNFDSPIKVVIVHESTTAGLQAANVLQNLATQLEGKLGIDINPWEICSHVWRFEWLQNPQLNEQAVAESIDADMIIISTENCTELPASVRSWIESVLPRKKGATALVAILGKKAGPQAGVLPSERYLRQLATHCHVDFLSHTPDNPATDNSWMAPVLCGFEDEPASSEAVLHHQNDQQRGWGLND